MVLAPGDKRDLRFTSATRHTAGDIESVEPLLPSVDIHRHDQQDGKVRLRTSLLSSSCAHCLRSGSCVGLRARLSAVRRRSGLPY